MIDKALLFVCDAFGHYLNNVIVILAILELVIMIITFFVLAKNKRKIKELNKRIVKGQKRPKTKKGETISSYEYYSEKNWIEYDYFLKGYQKDYSCYSTFSLIIQIFPLLGILGTVAGLYMALSNTNNPVELEGINLALSSTIIGLIFAIVFKAFDILLVARFVDYIEAGIERYEKDYQVGNEKTVVEEPDAEKEENLS